MIAKHFADQLDRFSVSIRPRKDILLVASAPLYDNCVFTGMSLLPGELRSDMKMRLQSQDARLVF